MVRTLHRDLGCDPAEARRALRLVAEGDLTEGAGAPNSQGLMGDLQSLRMALRELVQQVQGAAVQMHHVCAEIAQGNADLSDRTENQGRGRARGRTGPGFCRPPVRCVRWPSAVPMPPKKSRCSSPTAPQPPKACASRRKGCCRR